MKVKEYYTEYVKLNKGDHGFTVDDGVVVYNRAAIEISNNCPASVQELLMNYYSLGWIKPVAYVHKSELMFNDIKGQIDVDA